MRNLKRFKMSSIKILFAMGLIIFNFGMNTRAQSETEKSYRFDDVQAGSLPQDWKIDATNPKGALAQWEVVSDRKAQSAPNVLSITKINDNSDGVFNLFWNPTVQFQDGIIDVKIRANSGEKDQGGGLIWRVKDTNNYYIARYNPLEQNFRLYYVKDGVRKMLAESRGIQIKTGEWFFLAVSHKGNAITCWLNGQELLHAEDATFPKAGGVGLWTKADAASSFDDFNIQA